jgi:[acyl-carrier-protein] S-malonyltransferase
MEFILIVVAGLSLGEYSALVSTGNRFEEAVKLVRKRGKYMQEAVPERFGGMARPRSGNREGGGSL